MESYGWHNVRNIQDAAVTNCAQNRCGKTGCLVCQGVKDVPKEWGEELRDIKEIAGELGRLVFEHDIEEYTGINENDFIQKMCDMLG